jgi:hypothetical protein
MSEKTDLPNVSMANTKKDLLEAYEKVQDIANRAVTSARRDTYPAPIQQTSVPVRDDSKGGQ